MQDKAVCLLYSAFTSLLFFKNWYIFTFMQLITYYCIIHATCYIRWAIQITKALVFSTQSARLTPGAVKVLTVQAKRPKANHNKSPAVKVIHKNNRTMFLFSLYSEWTFKVTDMVLKNMWQSIKKIFQMHAQGYRHLWMPCSCIFFLS